MQCQERAKRVGLLGYPVAHSISPHIHNHAFRALKLPFEYVLLEVPPEDLAETVAALPARGFVGANVTIPHKQAAMALCEEVSGLSRLTSTVNTLYYDAGRLFGTTTDPAGFLRALAWMHHDAHGGDIVILGNGGVARTLGVALAHDRIPSRLTIAGRNAGRVSYLARDISDRTGFDAAWTTLDAADLRDRLATCTLLVNCTPVGMHPNTKASPLPDECLHAGMTVFDTVYNPAETRLLAAARNAGCPCQNGLRMLLYQGLASFTCWTGVEAPESLFDIEELQKLTSA
ncbi:MAG: shikimate dehydrogenase [Chitinivibrionales bacterium]|nr:shikimate dehydrogenase [Chitinivibrionales bacterium]